MKEFTVTKIELKKTKMSQVYLALKNKLESTEVFFELIGLKDEFWEKDFWAKNDMSKYQYTKQLLAWVDEITTVASNLNLNWDRVGEKSQLPISHSQAFELIKFKEKISWHYSTFLIGFDFNNLNERKYGYVKTEGYFGQGENYLSDSIIMAKDAFKEFYLYISESEEKNNPITVNEIQELFPQAKVIEENKYYMPSDEQESLEWEERYVQAKESIGKLKPGVKEIRKNLKYELVNYPFCGGRYESTINVKKISKKLLEPLGWTLMKNKPGQKGLYYVKQHLDAEITLNVIALEKGHYIQFQIYYTGKKFFFCEPIDYVYHLMTEEEVEHYFENLCSIMEYIEETLK